ncbi:MAG TPA: hypothetical protein VGI85_11570 [Chthoniobacterales bacterium]
MDDAEARLILQSYRPGDASEPRFTEALRTTSDNPELARWFAEEQAFDRAVAAHLENWPAPFGLKTRILAQAETPVRPRKMPWILGAVGFAAVVLLAAEGVNYWRSPAKRTTPSADYAREMTSFIELAPPLEMKSEDLTQIKDWLGKQRVAAMEVPSRLAALEPIGCRVLSYRGHRVTLICFHREEKGRLAHLFVVDRAALPKMKPGEKPIFDNESGWMTATWAEGNRIYMIALQGGRTAIERYLPDA